MSPIIVIRKNVKLWVLVALLSFGVAGCSGTVKPPVISGEDQAQVRAAATKVLAGIEVAGVIVRDGRQLVSELNKQGIVSIEVLRDVNGAVLDANVVVQRVITELSSATRLISVEALTKEAAGAMLRVADALERHSDGRIQTAGKFLRSAIAAVSTLVGGAR